MRTSRVNFEMNDAQRASLEDLQTKTGATIKDLINNGLSLVQWAVSETLRGNEIAAINEEQRNYRILVMPLLQSVIARQEQLRREQSNVAVTAG